MRVQVLIAALAASGALVAGVPGVAATASAPLSSPPREPVIRVRPADTPTARRTTYVLEARNPGRRDIRRAVVNQLLPSRLDYRGATPRPATVTDGQLRWTVAIPAGETVRIRVRGTVAGDGSQWNRFGVGERPRVDTTACISVDAASAVSDCHTASVRAELTVPWWRSLYALFGYALILSLGVPAGIVLLRRRRAAHRVAGRATERAAARPGPVRSYV